MANTAGPKGYTRKPYQQPRGADNSLDSYRDRVFLGKSPVERAGPKRFINKFDKKQEGMLTFGEYRNGDYITGRIHMKDLPKSTD
tara:strand:+ start:2343 stop:2597 length:255 start_codon:yes stop_codon:yes gene_type:complete